MATIRRIGFGTIFELENDVVGIGTDNPTHKLQALGNIRSEAVVDVGVSSLTTYQGFSDKEARFTSGQIDYQSQSGSTSSEIVIDGDVTVSSATTFTSGPQHLTVTDTFTLPSGDTNSRETKPTPGSLRFNQDFATLEFYTGNNWATVNTFTEIQNSPSNRGRGLLGGGQTPDYTSNIGFINISTFGNSQSFGNLSQATTRRGCSSSIRGLFAGGFVSPTGTNVIDYITIASGGDAIDFGDMTHQRRNFGAVSSSTRGIWSGGESPATINVMDYIQIATVGNSLDFGDLMRIRKGHHGINSSVRGIWVASQESGAGTAEAEVITIASKGNSVRFGGFSDGPRSNGGAASNPVKGIYAGGYTGSGTRTSQVFSCTIASEGNFINFTDLPEAHDCGQGMSNSTRGVFMGGYPNQSTNTMKSVEFSSGGESVVFGRDAAANRNANSAGISDSHGGLGGF